MDALVRDAQAGNSPQPALVIIGHHAGTIFGLTPSERLRRQFAAAGVIGQIPLSDAIERGGRVILVRADAVLDQPLIAALAHGVGFAILGTDGAVERPAAAVVESAEATAAARLLEDQALVGENPGLLIRRPSELDASFWKGLRKRETPYALLLSQASSADIERRVFMGTYKGATDFITKYAWPVPAYHVTRWLAPMGITPNMVTTVAAILTVAAFWLFLEGWFLTGLVAAWAMTFLDTVDGKLARTTLRSSKWGDVFDHGIDLVHPPFWYAAWGLGLPAVGLGLLPDVLWTVLGIILVGYVLQRLMEGIAIKWLGLEIHIWRRIDTLFRQVTARRNPNLALLTVAALAGRPDLGLIAVAAWTGLCLLLHLVQLLHAFLEKRRSGPLASWMETATKRS
ncbi:MAG: CDP-alcohol phosphatidyltransferase family protein [Parvibaculaceae bacterium]